MMETRTILKSDCFFFIVLFLIFIGIMFAMYSGYPYYPAPLPNEYAPQAAPANNTQQP